MNQAVTAPANFTPASCPLLAAVLPLRYAVGSIDPQNPPSSIDAQGLGLPAITGNFPELGPDHPVLGHRYTGVTASSARRKLERMCANASCARLFLARHR